MAEMVEIRWHGRGGQGTVTAAKVLADACLSGGRNVQAFPEYGPERAGAPLRAPPRFRHRQQVQPTHPGHVDGRMILALCHVAVTAAAGRIAI